MFHLFGIMWLILGYVISAGSLYRGILPPIMVEAPKRATKFAANEQYTTLYKKLFGFEKVTQSLSVLTGVSAGITEAFLIVPFELVKVRMQDKSNVSTEVFGVNGKDESIWHRF